MRICPFRSLISSATSQPWLIHVYIKSTKRTHIRNAVQVSLVCNAAQEIEILAKSLEFNWFQVDQLHLQVLFFIWQKLAFSFGALFGFGRDWTFSHRDVSSTCLSSVRIWTEIRHKMLFLILFLLCPESAISFSYQWDKTCWCYVARLGLVQSPMRLCRQKHFFPVDSSDFARGSKDFFYAALQCLGQYAK